MSVLKTAAKSVRKEQKLPDVTLSLLRLSLKENKFTLFWKEVVEQGLLKKLSWSTRYVRGTNLWVGCVLKPTQSTGSLTRLCPTPS